MIYDFNLLFSKSFSSSSILSDDEKVISIIEDESIDFASFPFTYIYQNNQDRNVTLATNRDFKQPTKDQKWLLNVENVISFSWKTQSGKISYRFFEEATEDIFRFWLYHIVLPIYFSIGQVYKFLHAGAVEIDDKPVLFMAPSHGGKSTMTDYFLQRGHPLITDDKMATYEKDDIYYAVPSHPYHRPFRAVEVLGNLCDNPATVTRPLHAIYILEKDEPEADIVIRELKGIEKFTHLHKGGEMNFSFFTPQYVAYLAGLANHVKMFSIKVPQDLERLEEVYKQIKEHASTIKGQI